MRRRGARWWRCPRGRRRTAPAASGSPIAISASSSSARSTKRCSTTSRACERGGRSSLAVRLGRPQGDRHVLHAAADRRLSRAPHARSAGARRDAGRILQLRVVDPAMGSGAFLVAACRYLADAYESRAACATGGCHAERLRRAPSASAIRRTIAERCLYGVDVNPMAVQLARLSLWLATLAADRPLTLSRSPSAGRRQPARRLAVAAAARRRSPAGRRAPEPTLPLFDDAAVVATRCATALPVRFSSSRLPERHARAGAGEGARARGAERAATPRCRDGSGSRDLWCARLVRAARRRRAGVGVRRAVGRDPHRRRRAAADGRRTAISKQPDAIGARRAGCFTGSSNSPRCSSTRDGTPPARRRLRRGDRQPAVGHDPRRRRRAPSARSRARLDTAPVVRFTRDAGVYTAQSDGHANRYQLFVERAIALTKPGGRLGLVLPSGLATDQGSAPLRRLLLAQCDVDALVGFDNRRGVFPIHRSVRFLLLTACRGGPTRSIACRLGERRSGGARGDRRGAGGHLGVVPDRVLRRRCSQRSVGRRPGDSRSARRRWTSRFVERAAALFPPLGSADGWHARFGRELNASDDRGAFRAPPRPRPAGRRRQAARTVPRRARLGAATASARPTARRLLRSDRHERPRLAYRDVASATNRLTLIAARPARAAASRRTRSSACARRCRRCAQHFLCGLFNSFVVNYLVRLRVTTHVTTAMVERLPIPIARGGAGGDAARSPRSARLLARGPESPARWPP